MASRNDVVRLVESWVGKNEKDGSFKEIIDIYNSYSPLPRGIKMQYNWAWCACTWSALMIKLGLTDISPIEISCGFLIDRAKEMGMWVENDDYIPSPGDAVLYDWQDNGKGDNSGWPDHVGTVTYVNKDSGYMIVTEGNYNDSVKKRTVLLNGMYIRGFIIPKYPEEDTPCDYMVKGKDPSTIAREVIAGVWGNGEERKRNLENYGYKYSVVQDCVNRILNGEADDKSNDSGSNDFDQPIGDRFSTPCYASCLDDTFAGSYETTANLYCRIDAGTNKKAMCKIPKGTKVKNYGYYTPYKGVNWLLIAFRLDRTEYIGFSSIEYLKKIK